MKFIFIVALFGCCSLYSSAGQRPVSSLYTEDNEHFIDAENEGCARLVSYILAIDRLIELQHQRTKQYFENENWVDFKTACPLSIGEKVQNYPMDEQLMIEPAIEESLTYSVFLNRVKRPIFKGTMYGMYEFAAKTRIDDVKIYPCMKLLLECLMRCNHSSSAVYVVVYDKQGYCQQNRIVNFCKTDQGGFVGKSQSNYDTTRKTQSRFERRDVSGAQQL